MEAFTNLLTGFQIALSPYNVMIATLDIVLGTVIGVLPGGFENVLSPAAEIWSPLKYDTALPPNGREWGHHLRLLGRGFRFLQAADAHFAVRRRRKSRRQLDPVAPERRKSR